MENLRQQSITCYLEYTAKIHEWYIENKDRMTEWGISYYHSDFDFNEERKEFIRCGRATYKRLITLN